MKQRRNKIVLEDKTFENMLKERARGYSYAALAGRFRLGSRQEVHKLIKKGRGEQKFNRLYREIDKTEKFLSREI